MEYPKNGSVRIRSAVMGTDGLPQCIASNYEGGSPNLIKAEPCRQAAVQDWRFDEASGRIEYGMGYCLSNLAVFFFAISDCSSATAGRWVIEGSHIKDATSGLCMTRTAEATPFGNILPSSRNAADMRQHWTIEPF